MRLRLFCHAEENDDRTDSDRGTDDDGGGKSNNGAGTAEPSWMKET
jgi:hypothetical protein